MSERETSFAKSVQLDSYQQSLLDRVERLKSQFNNRDTQKSADKQGSSMVEKDSSTAKNKPPEHMTRDVDRQVHGKNMVKDDKVAKKSQKQRLMEQQERLKQTQDTSKSGNSNKNGYSNDM